MLPGETTLGESLSSKDQLISFHIVVWPLTFQICPKAYVEVETAKQGWDYTRCSLEWVLLWLLSLLKDFVLFIP